MEHLKSLIQELKGKIDNKELLLDQKYLRGINRTAEKIEFACRKLIKEHGLKSDVGKSLEEIQMAARKILLMTPSWFFINIFKGGREILSPSNYKKGVEQYTIMMDEVNKIAGILKLEWAEIES